MRTEISLLLPLLFWAGAASAQNYLPLGVGNYWSYENDLGEFHEMEIVGEEVRNGVLTRVRRQTEIDQLFENFWTQGPDGDLFLHGARNFTFEIDWVYDPPVLMADGPLSLGKEWASFAEILNPDGTPTGIGFFDLIFEVGFEGDLNVPAGMFYSYGIGYASNAPAPTGLVSGEGRTFDLFGRVVDSWGPDPGPGQGIPPTDWYSDGLGVTQLIEGSESPFQLLPNPVPTAPVTWSEIKSRYRP